MPQTSPNDIYVQINAKKMDSNDTYGTVNSSYRRGENRFERAEVK